MCTGQECRDECSCRGFGLAYDRPTDFGLSQFGRKSLLYVIYRWVVGLFFAVSLFYGFASYPSLYPWWKWLIFLTHWGFAILTIATLLGAVIALHVYLRTDYEDLDKDNYKMPVAYRIYWVFNNISLSVAPLITVIYWFTVYDPLIHEANYPSITFHVVNTSWSLIDFFFSAVPIRILHFYQSMCFGAVYLLFNIIYWQAGGTNEEGERFIYSVVDFENEDNLGKSLAWVAFLFAGLVIFHAFWFMLYRLRLVIYRSCGCGQVAQMAPTK